MIYRPPEPSARERAAGANREVVLALLAMACVLGSLIWYTNDWWCPSAPWLCLPSPTTAEAPASPSTRPLGSGTAASGLTPIVAATPPGSGPAVNLPTWSSPTPPGGAAADPFGAVSPFGTPAPPFGAFDPATPTIEASFSFELPAATIPPRAGPTYAVPTLGVPATDTTSATPTPTDSPYPSPGGARGDPTSTRPAGYP